MEKRAVLFTANTQGGIIQFTVQLYHVLKKQNYKVCVFMPEDVKKTDLSELEGDLIKYKKEKKIFDNSSYKEIAKKIEIIDPDFVWYMDDSAVSQKVGLCVSEKIKQLLTMHDAGTIHPTNDQSLRTRAVIKYNQYIARKFYKKVTKFVLLSSESLKIFKRNYPQYSNITCMMNLGAHLPKDKECMPQELQDIGKYYLFFGRIDKYKGIENLLQAYLKVENCRYPLIIAGNGKLTDEENKLLTKCKNVILLNRYILDGEMKWLFSHCLAVVLPYIEATQSGIIPLAYNYNKAVLVSKIPGLIQFVDDKKTGFILENEEEWKQLFEKKTSDDYKMLEKNIHHYYISKLDWDVNIRNVLDEL